MPILTPLKAVRWCERPRGDVSRCSDSHSCISVTRDHRHRRGGWRHVAPAWDSEETIMKYLMAFAALAALQGSALVAQTLTGTWQGALKIPQAPNGELRVVVKISITEGDKLKADFYSIDQQTPAIPATTVSLSGSTFKMAVAALNGNFEGNVSGD